MIPRILRSMVMVSGIDPDGAVAAARAGADAICIDFEDLVPHDKKAEARALFAETANEVASAGACVMVRTNSLDSGLARADLEAAVGPRLHCVNIPKAEVPGEVARYCDLVETVEHERGLPSGTIFVRPIVETALGIKFAYEIAAASRRIAYMGGVAGRWWGDLGASLGYQDTADGRGTLYVRSKVLVDVRAAGVPFPIGGGPIASSDSRDIEAFFVECKVLGYTGVHCGADPAVIQIANQVMLPTPAEVGEWRHYLPALAEAQRTGVTSVWVDGRHLDVACLPRIQAQLELTQRVADGMSRGRQQA
jgi:citrate lyase subunit beta / citryl-CoA lyase